MLVVAYHAGLPLDGDDWVYRDGHHLTNRESATLAPVLREAIQSAADART